MCLYPSVRYVHVSEDAEAKGTGHPGAGVTGAV